MSYTNKPLVVAIAAVSGGGKTTIIKKLNKIISESTAIYFDDYEFDKCPDDICKWIEDGGDPNEWVLTPLIEGLQVLLAEKKYKYIIMDYPFAYLHKQVKDIIDYTIFIDTPLDIAMGRRIIRDFENCFDLKADLNNYLERGRKAYINMLQTVKPNSDFIIDGGLSIEVITDLIINKINYIL